MFTIIKGNEKELKKEMKEMSKLISAMRKSITKKTGGDLRSLSPKDISRIVEMEKAQMFLSVTTCIPAYWDDFLLNYKLANDIMKKLKGYAVTLEIRVERHQPRKLVIHYTNGRNTGFAELNELPKESFKDFKHILTVTPIGDSRKKAM